MDTDKKQFRHSTDIQIRFNDIDVIGHVNNAVYQHYFDLARMNYFRDIFGKDLDWSTFGIVLASIKIDFLEPVRIDESIAIRTKVHSIGEKSLTMVQEVYNTENGIIKAMNTSIMVGFSVKKKASENIPDHWKRRLIDYEYRIELKHPANSY